LALFTWWLRPAGNLLPRSTTSGGAAQVAATEFDCFSKVESSACAATTCRARQSAAGFVDRKLFFTEWKLLYNGISFIG
jgi:hypothetical protein